MKRLRILIHLAMAFAVCVGLVAIAPARQALALGSDVGPIPTSGGTAGSMLDIEADSYPIWVGNTRVSIYNARDVLGNGTVSYNASTNTLTLKNANIKKYSTINSQSNVGLYYDTSKALTIKLVGNNTISAPARNSWNYGIANFSSTPLIICGSGRLTTNGGSATWWTSGIVADKLTVKDSAVVMSRGGTATTPNYTQAGVPTRGSFGAIILSKITLAGKARLATYGKQAAYYRAATMAFGSGYKSKMKAGSSSSSISATRTKLASSSYNKFKYIWIGNSSTSYKPAKMKITAIASTASTIRLSWTALSTNCTGYQAQISKSSGFPSGKNTWTFTTTNKKTDGATISSLAKSTKYYVRIRGINKRGSKTYYGAWSATRAITTKSTAAAG